MKRTIEISVTDDAGSAYETVLKRTIRSDDFLQASIGETIHVAKASSVLQFLTGAANLTAGIVENGDGSVDEYREAISREIAREALKMEFR